MNLRRDIFAFIMDLKTRWNVLPSTDEIRWAFRGRSDDLDLHLEQLAREGFVKFPENSRDEIALVPTFEPAPILEVRSVKPSQLHPQRQVERAATVTLDLTGIGIEMEANAYAMLVPDDSMSDGDLFKGDIAIMKDTPPERGQVVAVQVNGEMLLRRFVEVQSIPHILAENPVRPDLQLALDVTFHGVLWALIRINPSCRPLMKLIKNRVSYMDKSTSGAGGPGQTLPPATEATVLLPRAHKTPRIAKKTAVKRTEHAGVQRSIKPLYRSSSKWPKPPSGAGLNEPDPAEYNGAAMTLVDTPHKYNAAFEEALKQFEREKYSDEFSESLKRREKEMPRGG